MRMKFSIAVLSVCVLTALVLPCSAQAQSLRMGKAQEASIGKDMYEEFRQKPGLSTSGADYEQVQRIGRRIVEANDLREYDYTFHLVSDDAVNAFATPGGYLYVNRGLVRAMGYDESMLAGVMAHEIGHAKDRHVARGAEKQMQSQLGLGLLGLAIGRDQQTLMEVLGGAAGIANLKYSRDMEEWADTHGVELAYNAGYDPYGMVRGLETLAALHGSGNSLSEWFARHPSTSNRITRTTGIAREVSGREHGFMPIPCPPANHPLYETYRGRCSRSAQIDSDYPYRRPTDRPAQQHTHPVEDGGARVGPGQQFER